MYVMIKKMLLKWKNWKKINNNVTRLCIIFDCIDTIKMHRDLYKQCFVEKIKYRFLHAPSL